MADVTTVKNAPATEIVTDLSGLNAPTHFNPEAAALALEAGNGYLVTAKVQCIQTAPMPGTEVAAEHYLRFTTVNYMQSSPQAEDTRTFTGGSSQASSVQDEPTQAERQEADRPSVLVIGADGSVFRTSSATALARAA